SDNRQNVIATGGSNFHSSLFQPAAVRGICLPSRVILAPINTGFARNGQPEFSLLRFHTQRSRPEIGISTIGNVAVDSNSAVYGGTVVLQNRTNITRLAVIARAIKRRGSLAGIQLAASPDRIFPSRDWYAKDQAAEISRLRTLLGVMSVTTLQTSLDYFLN